MGCGTRDGSDGEALAAVRVDVRYALGQLRNFGDTGRAVDALDRADELLTGLCGRWEAGEQSRPATPEDAGTRFPGGRGAAGRFRTGSPPRVRETTMGSLLDSILDNTPAYDRSAHAAPRVVSAVHDLGAINWVAGMTDPGEMIGCGMYQELRRLEGETDAAYAARLPALRAALPAEHRAKFEAAGRGAVQKRPGWTRPAAGWR